MMAQASDIRSGAVIRPSFRSPTGWLGYATALFGVGMWAWGIGAERRLDAVTAALTVFVAGLVLIAVRAARARVDYYELGLITRNVFGTRAVRWSDIDSVGTGPYLTYMQTARVRSGHDSIPLFAVHELANNWPGTSCAAQAEIDFIERQTGDRR